MKLLIAAFTLLAALPACVSAQANPDSMHLRNECRLATQVMMTGHPRPRLPWAAETLPRCRGFPSVVAAALVQHRASTDTAFLTWITQPANSVRDAGLLSAALAVLEDRSASVEARVFASRLLYWHVYPGAGVYYSTLVDVDGDGRTPCILFGSSSHLEVVEGESLPADWRERIYAAATRTLRDETEPEPVRQSAVCVALRAQPR